MLLANKVPKKNLIKLFTDTSMWLITGSASVVSETIMKLVANASYVGVPVYIDVKPNTQYTFSLDWEGVGAITPRLDAYTSNAFISQIWNNNVPALRWTYTFTTPATCTRVRLLLQNSNNTGTFLFKNPQLEEGATATPFEPYTLVNPKASIVEKAEFKKGNLIKPYPDPMWSFSDATLVPRKLSDYPFMSLNGYTFTMTDKPNGWYNACITVPVKPNRTYTFSNDLIGFTSQSIRIDGTDNNMQNTGIILNTSIGADANKRGRRTFNIPAGTYFIKIYLQSGYTGTYTFQNMQLEQLLIDTPFKPFKEENETAQLYPKKNLIPDLVSFPNTNDRTKLVYENENRLIMNATALTDYVNIQFPAKKGKLYNFWATELNENARVAIREVKADGTKTFLTNLTQIYMSHTFTTTSSVDKIEIECTVKTIGKCIFDKIQLEEGSKTTFERYQLTNLRSE